ncbi:hypothetical protein L249_7490, partial [Ophiocordyceps polyrhachis-furcata BCC 54312]
YFGGSARHSHTHTQGTRPEGLGGSRDAGPAVAGPRPPYVTEAEAATPYSGYGRTGRTGRTKEGTIRQARRAFFSNTISLRVSILPSLGTGTYGYGS